MAKRKISDAQLKKMKEMVVSGVTPDEISKHFGIAISSVHNYKRQLKDAGVSIPDIRGKRPSDREGNSAVESLTTAPAAPDPAGFTVIINGVSIYVTNAAKSVAVGPNSLTVSF
jgi:transposase